MKNETHDILGCLDKAERCTCAPKAKFATKSPRLALFMLLRSVAKCIVAGGNPENCSVYRCPTCKRFCVTTKRSYDGRNMVISYTFAKFTAEKPAIDACVAVLKARRLDNAPKL